MSNYAEGNIESTERGTCARANGGKVSFSLIPLHLLYGCARVLVWGTRKYATWNWAKGGKWSTPLDCMMRHIIKWWFFGEECDQESGLHHLDHAMCNLLFLIHYRDSYREGDDRPPVDVTHFNESLEAFCELFSVPPVKPDPIDGETVVPKCGRRGCESDAEYYGFVGSLRVSACGKHAPEVEARTPIR